MSSKSELQGLVNLTHLATLEFAPKAAIDFLKILPANLSARYVLLF